MYRHTRAAHRRQSKRGISHKQHCDLICFPSNASDRTAAISFSEKTNKRVIIPRFGKSRSLREKIMIHELSHLANGAASSKSRLLTVAFGISFLVLSPLLTTWKQKERRKKFFQFSIPEKAFGMEGRPKESEALELAKLFSRIWMVKGHV